MKRLSMLFMAALVLMAIATTQAKFMDDPTDDGDDVQVVPRNAIQAYSAQDGMAVIGSLAGATNGHVVVVRPGTDQVWDGNLLGGFKDMLAGRDVTNARVLDKMNLFINDGNRKNGRDVKKLSNDQLASYADSYIQNGAPLSYSWKASDLKKVQFYQVPTDQDVSSIVKNYNPPVADSEAKQNLRCNDLVQKAVPDVKVIVMDELAPGKGQQTPDVTANNIGIALQSRAVETMQAQQAATPTVTIPPAVPQAAIFLPVPQEVKVVPKPGGVIIAAMAQMDGLKPEEVKSASFDESAGLLILKLRSGSDLMLSLDPDNFAVAVRCVFERKLDPSLSMEYPKDKPGYKQIKYCGPLFQTRFGETMYLTDDLLGDIIFNVEGDHRRIVAGLVPGYIDLVSEAKQTQSTGSRVFLRARGARFVIDGDRLVCAGIDTKIDVEGMGNSAAYYQESLHRLARLLDKSFNTLTEQFDEFAAFGGLVQCVAMARWLERNSVPFDAAKILSRKVSTKDFPAYVPDQDWYSEFNGRNLDGWQINLTSSEIKTEIEKDSIRLTPNGSKSIEMLTNTWYKGYEQQYTIVTRGPVELLIRDGKGPAGASVTIDTKGRPKTFKVSQIKGTWTVTAPRFAKTGQVTIPESKIGQLIEPNRSGFRIPSGSSLTVYAVLTRGRS